MTSIAANSSAVYPSTRSTELLTKNTSPLPSTSHMTSRKCRLKAASRSLLTVPAGARDFSADAMDRYQYLLLMLGCFLVTLPLELAFRARVYRQPARWLRAVSVPFVLFVLWDAFCIGRNLWDFNRRFVTGWTVGLGVPVEEVVFFLVIPTCALLSYEACRRIMTRRAT